VHRLKNQRGQALVEFALILPILLAIIVAVFDFGSAFNQKNDLNFLANEAARYAEVNACAPCTGSQKIGDYVQSSADTKALSQSMSISFCLPDGTNNVGDPIQVTASAPFNWLGVLKGSGLPGGPITIRSTVTTRILAQPPDDNGKTWYSAASSC
jgi:Flp pilus assembly protein TadG